MTALHLRGLFEPLALGSHSLRNRIIVTAHATHNIDALNLPNDDDVAYFAERAKGGAALVTMGTTAVHPSSPTPYGIYHNFDDRILPRYEALSQAVHGHGALIVAQLGHMGARTDGETGSVWAPSPVSHHLGGSIPYEMSGSDIKVVIQAFSDAAERAVRGGLDGVEISVGHGQLVNLFLSPMSNQRQDAYGGSDENRYRFCRQVLEGVRETIGDALLLVRINGSDEVPGSLNQSDWLDIAQRIDESGLVDAMNVSANFGGSVIPTMEAQRGCYLHYARAVKSRVKLPVGAVGRITDPAMAAEAIRNGDADFVGMTRAHIADPHLVLKVIEGRHDEIRPCIGCIQMCQGELSRHRNIKCVYNTVTGRERFLKDVELTTAPLPKKVVVVGGGPAGLEAARVSALRGHSVVLFDERRELGGTVRVAARVEGRQGLVDATDWLSNEIRRLGVQVNLKRTAEVRDILKSAPDIVVLATGASVALPQWAPSEHRRLVGASDVVAGQAVLSGKVVVVDESNRTNAISAALVAAASGCEVTLLTSRPGPAELVESQVRAELAVRVLEANIEVRCSTTVRGFDPTTLTLRCSVGGVDALRYKPLDGSGQLATGLVQLSEIDADWVVHTWTEPRGELFGELPDTVEVHAVGDVMNPHRIEGAVHDAFRLAASF